MNVNAVLGGVLLKFLQIVGQMRLSMFLDLAGRFAQVFPFGQSLCHTVALLAHAEERLVVAGDHSVVLQVGFGSHGMFCTHSPADNICAT